MRLSLIVPCFNEQDNIFPFARTVAEGQDPAKSKGTAPAKPAEHSGGQLLP